jgi:hypothetical protein
MRGRGWKSSIGICGRSDCSVDVFSFKMVAINWPEEHQMIFSRFKSLILYCDIERADADDSLLLGAVAGAMEIDLAISSGVL